SQPSTGALQVSGQGSITSAGGSTSTPTASICTTLSARTGMLRTTCELTLNINANTSPAPRKNHCPSSTSKPPSSDRQAKPASASGSANQVLAGGRSL